MIKFIICSLGLISISAWAENVSFKLEGKDLKVAGQISSQSNKSIFINGSDLSGAPYKLEVTRELKGKGLLSVGYVLDRNGTKQSSIVIAEKNKLAKIESKQEDSKNPGLVFEITVSD